jgi:hypothetical protein
LSIDMYRYMYKFKKDKTRQTDRQDKGQDKKSMEKWIMAGRRERKR